MLFADQRTLQLNIPSVGNDGQPSTIAFLIDCLCQNAMKDSRKDLFVLEGHLYVAFFCFVFSTIGRSRPITSITG
jgi:hypothetical protein